MPLINAFENCCWRLLCASACIYRYITLFQVHEKDKMLANFHSELLFDLDMSATITPGFRFLRKPAERMHSSYSDSSINKCLRLLNVHDEESLFDSICTLKRESTISSNECDLLKNTVLHLQEKLEMCEGTLSLNEEVYRSKEAEFQCTLESLQTGKHRSALDLASLQEQAVFCQAVFDRLDVSNYADAILSIKTLQASEMSMSSLQSNLCEMKAGEEVLCVRIRELEQLVSIAAREYDALEEDAVNLRESVLYAAAEKELLMKFSQQIDLEKNDFEAKYLQQKTKVIQMAVEAWQDAETKQTVRRQVAFKRICCLLLRRLQYRAWVRWSEYVEQHNRANQACKMMLNRTRKLQILCAFQIWTVSTYERKKMRSAKLITRTNKITRRKNVVQRFCRVLSYRSLSSAWRLWKDYVKTCLKFQEALISIAKDNSNCIKLRVWKMWKKYCKQCSRAKQACTKFIKGMLNFGKLRAWRQWMIYVEQRVRSKVLCTNITNKMKKRKAFYAFQFLLKNASVSKWRDLRCIKTLRKTQNTVTYMFFCIWRTESKRSTDMKCADQIHSLKSSCDAISQSHTESSARLEEVRFQLLQSTFAKEQFEIDIITKDAQLQISKLQLEKVLQETKHEHQQLVMNFEQQSQKMQRNIHDVSCESQLRHARILHLEHELQQLQLVYSDVTSTMEQQNLRISNLVLHQEDLRKQNVTIAQESEKRIIDLESKLRVASQSNRDLSEQIIDLSDQIQQHCKCLLQRDSVTAALQTKSCDQENEILSLTKTTESLQALISCHISAVSSLIRDMLSTSHAIRETNAVSTLDEVRVFIQRCWDVRSEEVQVSGMFWHQLSLFSHGVSGVEKPPGQIRAAK
jgi:hypothetical protein